ncbi:hypothetical protein ES705_46660 [subsurface metagenome]
MSSKERIGVFSKLEADWFIHVFPDKTIARIAKKASITNRIGTSHRTYHWLTCNKSINFSRRKSDLHEAQLNCILLKPLEINIPPIEKFWQYYGFENPEETKKIFGQLLDSKRKNIVLHPKSKGTAREWGLENFERLIRLLPEDQFKIFITGTQDEAELMKEFLERNKDKVTNITGTFTLNEFVIFLSMTDGMVACSTGPLHIAAALGKTTVGIYPPIRPMHPGRWAPLGKQVHVLVKDTECNDCRKSLNCHCMREISPETVKKVLVERCKR